MRKLEQEPTYDRIIKTRNSLDRLLGKAASKDATRRTSPSKEKIGKPGRRFISTDGFEVLTGRNDRDNNPEKVRLKAAARKAGPSAIVVFQDNNGAASQRA